MTYAALVDVLDAGYQLLIDPTSRFLVETLVLHDVVEQLSVATVLHYHEEFYLCLNYLKKVSRLFELTS